MPSSIHDDGDHKRPESEAPEQEVDDGKRLNDTAVKIEDDEGPEKEKPKEEAPQDHHPAGSTTTRRPHGSRTKQILLTGVLGSRDSTTQVPSDKRIKQNCLAGVSGVRESVIQGPEQDTAGGERKTQVPMDPSPPAGNHWLDATAVSLENEEFQVRVLWWQRHNNGR